MTQLSIIFSTWNSLRYLTECLGSLFQLDIEGLEVIIVDSNSTDGTREYLDGLASEHNRLELTVFHSEKRMPWSEANQIGLDMARGEWICLSNPDILFSQAFKEMFKKCQSNGVSAAAPQLIYPDGRLQRPARTFTPWLSLCTHTRLIPLLFRLVGHTIPSYLFPYHPDEEEVEVDNPQGSMFIIHQSILERFHGHLWNPGYLNGVSDFDAFLNMKEHGIPIIIFPHNRIVHYGSYISKKYPDWIERDQSYGFVLYFRYHPNLSRRISPSLYSVLFGLEGITVVGVDIVGKIVSRNPFFKPRHSAWKTGQRLMGLFEGWRYRIVPLFPKHDKRQ